MTEYTKLKDLFQQYMETSLIDNQHLIDTMFHNFCGVVFPIKSFYGGITLIPRVWVFPIQDSGTGKTQAGEAEFWLIRFILPPERVSKCVKTSDAGLIGSPDWSKKKEAVQSRLLFKKDFLYWDEGSILLKDTPFSEDLQDILQMAADPSRWIEKHLKDGSVSGYTNTSVVAGSYLEEGIKYSILRRGFFHRWILTYKKFTEDEKIRIMEGLARLENPDLYLKRRVLQSEIRKELVENYGFKYPVSIEERKLIKPSIEVTATFTERYIDYYKNNIMQQYMDNRQGVLESCWARVRYHTYCIAVQNAFLHHREELIEEDYNYAFDLVEKYHVQGMKTLLDNISDDKTQYKSINKSSQKDILIQCIAGLCQEKKGPVTQTQVLDYITYLKNKKDSVGQKPNFGKNRAWEWIKEMEQEGLLKVEKGDNNANLISIASKTKE